MIEITLVFEGGSRGNPGAGFGRYAIIKGNQRTVTHLEFGGTMTTPEAEYDTLITALETLVHQERASETALTIQGSSQLVVNQLKGIWRTREARLRHRFDRVSDLLGQFRSVRLSRIPRERVTRLLKH